MGDRTKFIMNLIKEDKIALVSNVGDLELTSYRNMPIRACRKKAQSNSSSENESIENPWTDFHSSGSEYVPSDSPITPDYFDLGDISSDHSEEIPIQSPIMFNHQMEMEPKTPSEKGVGNKISQSKKDAAKNDNFDKNNKPVERKSGCNFSEGNISHVLSNAQDFGHQTKLATTNIKEILKNGSYDKSKSSRERPTICPICFSDVVTHFSRHLTRHHANHKDVKLLNTFKPGSKERLNMVAALRKQGNFHLRTEKGVLHPVRSSGSSDTEYYTCTFCLGHYSKKLLYKHVKKCKGKPTNLKSPGRRCLAQSQTFMASVKLKNQNFLKASRIRLEVFSIMRADNISFVAKSDPLIALYGETLLNKHKRRQIATVVSNKIREMARLLIAVKSFDSDVTYLFDLLKPGHFENLISATKIISNYDIETKSFKSPSLALHMGTNLKTVCDVAYKIVLQNNSIPNMTWINKEETKQNFKELRELIVSHWCNEISSLALKDIKEKQWEKPAQLPLTKDIETFQLYLNTRADKAYESLTKNTEFSRSDYKMLTECVLTLTVMFNRKRVGDVQYLKINNYMSTSQIQIPESFMKSLTTVEKVLSQKFKRVVTGGKGSKPVPILFSNRLQKFISCLLNVRDKSDIVPKSNPYLFANPGSTDRWISGSNVISRLAKECGAENPSVLTSTKFRKHIATTLQLMSMDENDMEQIAKFMGHTAKTHAEFYRLPQDIYQTAKVAKILLLLEKGKGHQFHGKNINEIDFKEDTYYSSESEHHDDDEEDIPLSERVLSRLRKNEIGETSHTPNESSGVDSSLNLIENIYEEGNYGAGEKCLQKNMSGAEAYLENDDLEEHVSRKTSKKKYSQTEIEGRHRWTPQEKKVVLNHFKHHIKKCIAPKKAECQELISSKLSSLKDKDWVKVKTLVYNTFRQQ